jgi:hypothetical protein
MEFQVIKITAAMKFLAREAVEARLGMIERALTLFNLGHRMSASSFFVSLNVADPGTATSRPTFWNY